MNRSFVFFIRVDRYIEQIRPSLESRNHEQRYHRVANVIEIEVVILPGSFLCDGFCRVAIFIVDVFTPKIECFRILRYFLTYLHSTSVIFEMSLQ